MANLKLKYRGCDMPHYDYMSEEAKREWENNVESERWTNVIPRVGPNSRTLWFRIQRYDPPIPDTQFKGEEAKLPRRRFILNGVQGWKEYGEGTTFTNDEVFRLTLAQAKSLAQEILELIEEE